MNGIRGGHVASYIDEIQPYAEFGEGQEANLTLRDYGRFVRRPERIILKAQCEPLNYDLSVEVFHCN
jgi:hypothetical protein